MKQQTQLFSNSQGGWEGRISNMYTRNWGNDMLSSHRLWTEELSLFGHPAPWPVTWHFPDAVRPRWAHPVGQQGRRQVKWESIQCAWLLGWRKCQFFFFFLTQNYSLPTSSLSVFTYYYFFNIQTTTALQILKEAAALKQEVPSLSRRALRLGPPS